jgi:hypothetical protein
VRGAEPVTERSLTNYNNPNSPGGLSMQLRKNVIRVSKRWGRTPLRLCISSG